VCAWRYVASMYVSESECERVRQNASEWIPQSFVCVCMCVCAQGREEEEQTGRGVCVCV